jgi:hypothetical protein
VDDQPVFVAAQVKDDPIVAYEVDGATKLPLYLGGICLTRLQRHYDDDTIAELIMIIAWQNAGTRFNRAFRIPSQEFWKR